MTGFFKSNIHWLSLAAVSAASVCATGFLFVSVQDLPVQMNTLRPKDIVPKKLQPLDLSSVYAAIYQVRNPAGWATQYPTVLFAPHAYILEDDTLKKPQDGSLLKHSKTDAPIPNSWFLKNKLPLFKPGIAQEDSDGDGFTNEEEWAAGTDPMEPDSHPPLVTKLYFVSQQEIHNRVRFMQYLGDPTKPESLRITVRLEDAPKRPQHELKVGDPIPNTTLTVVGFTPRRTTKPGIQGSTVEASVITISDSKDSRQLEAEIRGEAVDFSDKTVTLHLFYPKADRQIVSKPGQTIKLDESEAYQLIGSNASSATLKGPSETTVQVTYPPSE